MNTAVDKMFPPSITFLNFTGDITITWTEENRERILELVRKKMAEGYIFFTVGKVPILNIERKKVRVTKKNIDEIKSITIPDKEFDKIMANVDDPDVGELLGGNTPAAKLTKRAGDPRKFDGGKRAMKPEEVIDEQSVVTKPVRGG